MKILTFNWHTPYLSMLARLDHDFEVAPPNLDSSALGAWDKAMRPLPPNVKTITKENARERLMETGYYDLLLAHNVKDIVMAARFKLPKILVFHNKLSTEAKLGGDIDAVDGYRENVTALVSQVYCVFISQTKRFDWGLTGDIIMPGIDASMYGGYTGKERRALRVGNSMKARDLMTGYSLQEVVLKGLPSLILGENPDIPGCGVSKGWEDLKQAYRASRLFLNTSMPPWEDGYNLATLEAMATGCPVVSMANPTCPITDGVDGFVHHTAEGIRERVIKLLDDIELAKKTGEEGRRTVERLFPMTAYLEKWERAIDLAYSSYPGEPHNVFPPAKASATAKPKPPPIKAGGKNVILSYTSYPATAAAYFDRAFREKHNVITAGCKLTSSIIEAWNLQNLQEKAKTHDIDTPDLTLDINFMLEKTPDGFEPDFFIWFETGLGKAPDNLEKLACPKAAYLIDTHIHFERDLEAARGFDVVFLAQRKYIPEFQKRGIKDVRWLPLACDPAIHGKAPADKKYDVGFVGSLTDERRVMLLQKLAEVVDVRYERAFLKDMARLFCESRIVFNNAILDDLNMRVFEALCSGSMLLTDRADGMDEFFKDRKSLVIYNDDNIARIAEYYIENHDERERIAKRGRAVVLQHHTYAHRVDDIVRIMDDIAGGA
ncbi:hypothetical protein MNBD_NITROSPINAE02-655 [hydrothermal vent metagenome]|uniref:Spore protein YkvP/CgeB glycosyl transferase-like domain-containing protein n=1 Tax=hydrothermal vent metagenome TaxID=652676 RepID=A0A3B1C554_9ZZZZ